MYFVGALLILEIFGHGHDFSSNPYIFENLMSKQRPTFKVLKFKNSNIGGEKIA